MNTYAECNHRHDGEGRWQEAHQEVDGAANLLVLRLVSLHAVPANEESPLKQRQFGNAPLDQRGVRVWGLSFLFPVLEESCACFLLPVCVLCPHPCSCLSWIWNWVFLTLLKALCVHWLSDCWCVIFLQVIPDNFTLTSCGSLTFFFIF